MDEPQRAETESLQREIEIIPLRGTSEPKKTIIDLNKPEQYEWAMGVATAMKAGIVLHLTIPRPIQRKLEIENRDILMIKIANTHVKRERRWHKSLEHFHSKQLSKEEDYFIEQYKLSSDPLLLSKANSQFGESRVKYLFKNFLKMEFPVLEKEEAG